MGGFGPSRENHLAIYIYFRVFFWLLKVKQPFSIFSGRRPVVLLFQSELYMNFFEKSEGQDKIKGKKRPNVKGTATEKKEKVNIAKNYQQWTQENRICILPYFKDVHSFFFRKRKNYFHSPFHLFFSLSRGKNYPFLTRWFSKLLNPMQMPFSLSPLFFPSHNCLSLNNLLLFYPLDTYSSVSLFILVGKGNDASLCTRKICAFF